MESCYFFFFFCEHWKEHDNLSGDPKLTLLQIEFGCKNCGYPMRVRLISIQVLLRRHTARTAAKTTSEASGHYRIVFPQPAQGAGPEGRLWLPVLAQRPAGPMTSPTAQRCSRLHLPHGNVLFLPGQGGEETSPPGRTRHHAGGSSRTPSSIRGV